MILSLLFFEEKQISAYESRVGEFYVDINRSRKSALIYLAIYCIRRLIFATAVVFMGVMPLF